MAPDILRSRNFNRMKEFIQHGDVTVNAHVLRVARCSIALSEYLHISCSRRELIRGALLHDYFFYDAQDGDPAHKGHWSRHPEIAWRNARQELELTGREEDIIRSHMFPVTLRRPPRCRAGAVVTLVDKGCSVYEFFKRKRPYPQLASRL